MADSQSASCRRVIWRLDSTIVDIAKLPIRLGRYNDSVKEVAREVGIVQTAMRASLPYSALCDMIFAHPIMSEGLNDLFERLD